MDRFYGFYSKKRLTVKRSKLESVFQPNSRQRSLVKWESLPLPPIASDFRHPIKRPPQDHHPGLHQDGIRKSSRRKSSFSACESITKLSVTSAISSSKSFSLAISKEFFIASSMMHSRSIASVAYSPITLSRACLMIGKPAASGFFSSHSSTGAACPFL